MYHIRTIINSLLLLDVIIGINGGLWLKAVKRKEKQRSSDRITEEVLLAGAQVAGYFSHKKIACYNWL